ncbi:MULTISPECIES: prolyl oligopeptidase family serine peptidase [Metallosphaera]|uniref:prolyl oligopeptidase family serine peptidase n=1 Tax=Metallosphaera TaxID=41980 RepID=UPI001F062614|nr:prolyl oligopeptidase family serine peptidase [Metallosphaera sedula]MCH1770323.1 prolyl oligopeptidase family serine peptidase [Metallosphaera sedula]MCP6727843.1 prolyl oligopeptidase family serine peptidase [Metallosphaera sedula]
MDPFEYLENLEDPRTKAFIEEETRNSSFLQERAKLHYQPILERLTEERPITLIGTEKGVAMLVRSKSGVHAEVNGNVIRSEREQDVFNSLERVWNSDLVRIGVGIGGSDQGYSILVDEQGKVVRRVDGLVNQFFFLRGKLCYVREYRTESSPDGVPPAVERLFCGEEMLPFYPGRGEWISVKAEGDNLLLVRGIGWSKKVLYRDFEKVDEGDITSYDMKGGRIYYVKGNSLMRDGVELFKISRPTLDMKVMDDGVLTLEIRNYKTSLVKYSEEGRETWNYTTDHILTFDVVGDQIYVLETSFDTSYVISRIEDQRVEVLRRGREERLTVKEIYVQGDVLLHGFLLSKGGNRGVVVYGYGGFAIPLLPSYNPLFLELMDSGYSVLVTNLRGGFENGEEWHKAGMLRNKMNVFKDFSEFLQTVKMMGGRTIAMGGSNGGLLVGATLNLYTSLVDCGVIGYPVLDMLKFHKYLAGMYWVPEYGDPEKDSEFLLSYSPYHNLKKGLPPTLVYTGLNDDRVHPMHALKYVAKSREMGNRVYLFVNRRAGHNLSRPEASAEEMSTVVAFVEQCHSL